MFLGHPSYQDPTIIHDRIDWLDVTSGLTSFSCLSLAVVDATGWADLQEIHGDAHTYTHSHSFTHGILRLHPPPEGTYIVQIGLERTGASSLVAGGERAGPVSHQGHHHEIRTRRLAGF